MNYILEADPMEALHDDRCPCCNSTNIEFISEDGVYAVNILYQGKLCQLIYKSKWYCHECGRYFTSNKFITQ